MVAAAGQLPGVAEFYAANPNAPPDEMLRVVLAETERLKFQAELKAEENKAVLQDWRETNEVELDENFNYKPKNLSQVRRLARMYSDSAQVPDHYKGKLEDTAISVQMALRCRVDIMTFLQSSYVVHGKPGIEGKLVIAMLNCATQIDGRVSFEYTRNEAGKITACRAYCVDAKTKKEVSQTVTWEMVVAEGWDKEKKGQKSKWLTLPDVMFAYRSAAFLGRVHFPDVLMGMYTIDELEDMGATQPTGGATVPTTAAASGSLAELTERLGAPLKPVNGRAKTVETKALETASEKPQDNDPFAPNPPRQPVAPPQETKTEPPVEVSKPAAKAPGKPSAVKETHKPAEQPKQPRPNAETLQGYISTTYSDRELADFNVPLIVESLIGNKDFTRIVESIISREHPQHAEYLKAELQVAGQDNDVEDTDVETDGDQTGPEDDVSQDAGEDSGDEGAETEAVDQDVPDFLSNPVKRPKMGLMAIDAEKVIIGKRNPEMIRRYRESDVDGKNHPHLDPAEQAYLISLADRRAYQLEHSIPPTDKLPR